RCAPIPGGGASQAAVGGARNSSGVLAGRFGGPAVAPNGQRSLSAICVRADRSLAPSVAAVARGAQSAPDFSKLKLFRRCGGRFTRHPAVEIDQRPLAERALARQVLGRAAAEFAAFGRGGRRYRRK